MKEVYNVNKDREAHHLIQRVQGETHAVKARILAWIRAIRHGARHVVETLTITQGGNTGHVLVRKKYYFGKPTCCPCSEFMNAFCRCKNCDSINLYHTYLQ